MHYTIAMNAITEVVYPSPGYSFCFQITRDRKLHFNWHHHAEYELAVCRNGDGEAHIGDIIISFKGPVAFFISPQADHSLVSKDNFDGWIIQIPAIIMDHYKGRPEFHFLMDLIRRSAPALQLSEAASAEIVRIMEKAQKKSGVFRWICLLEAFHTAAADDAGRPCAFCQGQNEKESGDIFDEIITGLFNKAEDAHNVKDAAESAGMSISSFCRRFRKKTGMTFVEYLNGVRINNAKKLLQQSKMYVDDIAYECGFNSISFFNRKFKKQTGMTPLEYRRHFGAG
ncbi:AraC family transcriptional regulator [Spirochaetia bacterium]|nr:AraC family transcriptional regulator [Spirochaetia bacterium]